MGALADSACRPCCRWADVGRQPFALLRCSSCRRWPPSVAAVDQCSLLCCFITRCSYVLDTGIRFTHQEFKTQARPAELWNDAAPAAQCVPAKMGCRQPVMLLVRMPATCAASADGGQPARECRTAAQCAPATATLCLVMTTPTTATVGANLALPYQSIATELPCCVCARFCRTCGWP